MLRAMVACAAGTAVGAYCSSSPQAQPITVQCARAYEPCLSAKEFRKFPIMNVYDESPDSKVFRFALPHGDQTLGMQLASCVVFRTTTPTGEEVIRPYTPISRLHQEGYVDFLVKKYQGSKMGTHLHDLKVGDQVEMKGPFVKLAYKPGMYQAIGMIAGGSGITPMFQMLREVLKEKTKPEVNLIYANRRKEDVLLGNELNQLMEVHRNFSPYFVLSDPPMSWMGGVGHVTKDMIKAFMPPPSHKNAMVLVCGPPKFMDTICGDKNFEASPPTQGELKGYLKELGYTSKQVFKF